MEISLVTHPKRVLYLKSSGLCTLVLAFAVSGVPDFMGCMHEAARQAEVDHGMGDDESTGEDSGQPPQ
jgi:hypothetical protein